jgi:hypothetical protein
LSMYYTNETNTSDDINSKLENHLNTIIDKHEINCVIISTEPLSHFKYAKFAINKGLHILLDKPVTAYPDVVNNIENAYKIYDNFLELKSLYLERRKLYPDLVFNVMAQRRFHPSFKFVRDMLQEITSLTNCPITSYQLSHV